MSRRNRLPANVLHALDAADRKPGWNNRPGTIERFDIGCVLYVVPFRRWAWRKREKLAEQFRREYAGRGSF